MRKSKYTDEQVAMALRQAEAGTPVAGDLPETPDYGDHVLPVEEEVRGIGGP